MKELIIHLKRGVEKKNSVVYNEVNPPGPGMAVYIPRRILDQLQNPKQIQMLLSGPK